MRRFLLPILLLLCAGLLQSLLQPPAPPSTEKPIQLYYNDLQRLYERAIREAKQSVWLSIYGLNDPRILQALSDKAAEGVSVRVAYDAKASVGVHRKLHARVKAEAASGPGLLHRKLLVIDGKELWIGSSNLTTESLRIHANLVAAIHCDALAQGMLLNEPSGQVTLEGQRLTWHLLPEAAEEALDRLLALIDNAKQSLRIAMFTWTHPELTAAVIRAHERGVRVSVVLDYCSSRGASLKTAEKLAESGIEVAVSERAGLLHHKMAWIDETTLLLGSANWTRAAFSKNADVLLCIEGLERKARRQLQSQWSQLSAEAANFRAPS